MINSNLINDSIGGTYLSDSINLTSINQAFANISKNTREKPTLDFSAIGVGLFLSVFILFAILGNILVILSVQCNKNLQTVTNLFVINLAVADLLLSIVVLPFSASLEVLGCWIFGRSFCNVWAAVDVLCCTASILSLCVISIDRYIGVKYSLQYPTIMTKKKARVILVVVWISSMVVSIGPLLGWKEPPPLDESICSITEEPGYALFSSLFSFYLPLTVTMVMYFRIYVIARRTTKSMEAGVKRAGNKSMEVVLRIHCRNVLGEAAASNKSKSRPFRSSLSVRLMKFSREKKAAKTLAIVVGVFVLCWLPFFFVLPLCSLFPTLKPSEMVFKVIFWLGYFNSCVNPIIYPCSSKEFKRAFIQLLRGQCRHRTRTRWRFYDPSWRASVNSSKQDAVRNYRRGFSNPESITLNDSFLQKGQCETLSFQSWGFLTPLQKPSLNLKEKINNLSEKIKNGPGLNSAYALSQTTIDSVSMRISDDCADQRSYGTHDLTEYYALKKTDISNDTFSLDIYNV